MKDYNGRKLSIGDQVIFPYLPVDGGFLALKQGTITKEHKDGFMEVSFATAAMNDTAHNKNTRVVYVADVIKAR